jgi:hypothetical protein
MGHGYIMNGSQGILAHSVCEDLGLITNKGKSEFEKVCGKINEGPHICTHRDEASQLRYTGVHW